MNRESWPLDGVKFDTLKEQHDKRNPEDFEIDLGMSFMLKLILIASWAIKIVTCLFGLLEICKTLNILLVKNINYIFA